MTSDTRAVPDGPEVIWDALRTALLVGTPGWRILRWSAKIGRSLYAGIEPASSRRVILLPLDGAEAPPLKHWPRCAGLDPVTVVVSGSAHIGIALVDIRFADVFNSLAVDLARKVETASTAAQAVEALLGQMTRWQRFLSAKTEGLSPMAQRGLWGELYCLLETLIKEYGLGRAVCAWKGGEKAHQDFQFKSGAIEVKTTIAKQPQSVRITSERQLDNRNWPELFLHVLVLEPHEGAGETLPALVARIRAILTSTEATANLFEDAILAYGYQDAHSSRYVSVGYYVRQEHWFRVGMGFPCIIEGDLKPGVGEVAYALSLSACTKFSTDKFGALKSISE